jgi:hypothetical protein
MIDMYNRICKLEKTRLLSQCAILDQEMDYDVMNQQKYAVGTYVMIVRQAPPNWQQLLVHNYSPSESTVPKIFRHGHLTLPWVWSHTT